MLILSDVSRGRVRSLLPSESLRLRDRTSRVHCLTADSGGQRVMAERHPDDQEGISRDFATTLMWQFHGFEGVNGLKRNPCANNGSLRDRISSAVSSSQPCAISYNRRTSHIAFAVIKRFSYKGDPHGKKNLLLNISHLLEANFPHDSNCSHLMLFYQITTCR